MKFRRVKEIFNSVFDSDDNALNVINKTEWEILNMVLDDSGDPALKVRLKNAPEEILELIKQAAGSGSGLNADLLDGKHLLGADGIIERGSNANGEYTKFADGTLICAAANTSTVITDISFGSVYISAEQSVTFPAMFISTSGLIVNFGNRGGSDTGAWGGGRHVVSTTGFTYRALGGGVTARFSLGYIAAGRWY